MFKKMIFMVMVVVMMTWMSLSSYAKQKSYFQEHIDEIKEACEIDCEGDDFTWRFLVKEDRIIGYGFAITSKGACTRNIELCETFGRDVMTTRNYEDHTERKTERVWEYSEEDLRDVVERLHEYKNK